MKVKAHIRVAKTKTRTGAKIAAGLKPSCAPLTDNYGDVLPTVAFAVEFDVPEAMFKQAERIVATLTIPESQAVIAAEVTEHA